MSTTVTDTISINGTTSVAHELKIEARMLIPSTFASAYHGRTFSEQGDGEVDKAFAAGGTNSIGDNAWVAVNPSCPGFEADTMADADIWHDVALVRDDQALRPYVDRILVATNLTLTLPGAIARAAGGYYLVISNASGVVTSSVAFVAVVLPAGAPTISQQPQSRSVAVGALVTFTVGAAGTGPFTYLWQKDNVPIQGATAPSFTIAAVSVSDAGAYTVVVSNSGGSVTS